MFVMASKLGETRGKNWSRAKADLGRGGGGQKPPPLLTELRQAVLMCLLPYLTPS